MRTLAALLAAVVTLVLAPSTAMAGPNSPGCVSVQEYRNFDRLADTSATRKEVNHRFGTAPRSSDHTLEVVGTREQIYRGCFDVAGHPAAIAVTFTPSSASGTTTFHWVANEIDILL